MSTTIAKQGAGPTQYSKLRAGEANRDVPEHVKDGHLESDFPSDMMSHDGSVDSIERRRRSKHRRKVAMWKIEILGISAATLGTNIYSYLTFGGGRQFLACFIATIVSLCVSFYECTMPDSSSEYILDSS